MQQVQVGFHMAVTAPMHSIMQTDVKLQRTLLLVRIPRARTDASRQPIQDYRRTSLPLLPS